MSRATRRLPLPVAAVLAALSPAAALADCREPALRAAPRQDLALEVVGLVNAHRAAIGRPPLRVAPSLMRAALWKASDLVVRGYFAHDDPVPPRTPGERLAACGFRGGRWGEDLAFGRPEPEGAVAQWLGSPPHRAVLEDPEHTQVGVGVAGEARHWALALGGDAVEEPPEPAPVAVRDAVDVPAAGEAVAAVTANDRPGGGWLHVVEVGADPRVTATTTPDGRGVLVRPAPGVAGRVVLDVAVADVSGRVSRAPLVVRAGELLIGAPGALAAPGGLVAPVAVPDAARLRPRARRVAIPVLANDAGERLRVSLARAPRRGRARVTGRRIVYRPSRRWPGADALAYRVTDPWGASSTATVRIRGASRGPAGQAG